MNLGSKILLVPSIVLLIGAVIGTSATNTFADDPFKNEVQIDDDRDQKNDCDETADGTNNADCETEKSLNIGEIIVGKDTGTLIVTKIVECAFTPCIFTPDKFQILVTGDVDSGEVNPFPGSATGTEVTLGPGSYSVTEPNPPAGVLTTTFSSDCTGTINAGETKNCEITNRVPSAPV